MESKVKSKFEIVEEPNFPKMEEKILQFWREIKAFETQLEKTKNYPPYTFLDGPPFATGTPHYGHLTAGTLKDVVTRYWTQRGHYCKRVFGWDTHGLPIEVQINEDLGIKTKKDLLKIGIEKYNNECRKIIMKYADDWKYYTERYGRWIDFEKDYRTCYASYMETGWWIFKQIFDKGRVYRKCKIMPFSWACNTALSNFEAGQNYQDVNDPSVIVTFPIVGQDKLKILAWTTTPWTLPSNVFLTVNPTMIYVQIKLNYKGEENTQFILAEPRLKEVMKMLDVKDDQYEIVKKMSGKEFVDLNYDYEPLFKDFYEENKKRGCFKVYCADYVTASDGTGIVHNAPGFGEDDYQIGCKYNLCDPDNPLCPVDDDGCFTKQFPFAAGVLFKDADKKIIEHLVKEGRMIYHQTIKHSYPFCWRTNTPLMYRAIPCWFIKVEDLREELVQVNNSTYWVPKYAQEKRFGAWLANAKDWCVSRSRVWGNPIPIWVSDDFEEKICVGSIKELEELSGVKGITDLHRDYIDKITIPSKKGKGDLHRIEEVFDCWFESGSSPFAQDHFPFDITEEEFMKSFPKDFIAEGIDQTRGWFYTLTVISTILYHKSPYKNLIVNGLVLDEFGEKLSKSKKNYEDPKILFDNYGADDVRLYLMDSPLVKGQSLKFSIKGLKQKLKDVFLPLYNSYKFLIQNIHRYENASNKNFVYNPNILFEPNLNITDKWIIAYEQRLIKFFNQEMEAYRLYTVTGELLFFLDKLTNWYIRLNRGRIKGDFGDDDCVNSLNILFNTMLNLCLLLSPFIPFITESIYQNLKHGLQEGSPLLEGSIHFLQIPEYNEKLLDDKIEEIMKNMINVIELGRKLRESKKISLKKPIAKLTIINYDKNFLDNIKKVENYIIEELNTNEIEYIEDESKYIKLGVKPNYQILYQKTKEIKDTMLTTGKLDDPELKKEEEEAKNASNKLAELINKLTDEQIREIMKNNKITVEDNTILFEQVIIEKKFLPEYLKDKVVVSLSNSEIGIRIDTTTNEKIIESYLSREIVNRIQKFRKEIGIKLSDTISICYQFEGDVKNLKKVCENYKDNIEKVIKAPLNPIENKPGDEYKLIKSEKFEIGEGKEKETMVISIFKKD